MLSCFIHPSVFGQPFWLPTTGDIQLVGWPSMDVHHTGIAVQGDIQAVVYDGDHPGITVFKFNSLASGIYYLTIVTANKNEVFKIMK
jgi:hypothetical protein